MRKSRIKIRRNKPSFLMLYLAAFLIMIGKAVPASAQEASRTIFAMDTVMTLQAEGENAEEVISEAVSEILRLDALFSTGNPDSPVSILNRQGSITAPPEIIDLLTCSRTLWEQTGGAFDITIYPVMQLWGFPTQDYHVPSAEELENVRPLVGMDQVALDESTGTLSFTKEGMAIDFGAIAKGYTSSRIHQLFEERGMKRALVNLGGNVHAYRTKEGDKPWRIAIRDPWKPDQYLGVLEIRDEAVITSGGYERYFEEDGVTYHHIIDPATLCPANSGLVSVTIVCADGTLADGLSTSLFILGTEKAQEYWKEHSDEFEAILVTEDGTVLLTEGLEGRLTTEYPSQIVTSDR